MAVPIFSNQFSLYFSAALGTDDSDPNVVANADGSYAISFANDYANNASDFDTQIERYEADGTLMDSSALKVVYTDNNEYHASMASSGSLQALAFKEHTGSTVSIKLVLLTAETASGTELGDATHPPLVISTTSAGGTNLHQPEVAFLSDGKIAVTWIGSASGNFTQYVRVYDPVTRTFTSAETVVTGSTSVVNTFSSIANYGSQITALDNGNFAVTWWDTSQSGHLNIFSAAGTSLSGDVALTGSIGPEILPQITQLANGNIFVAYVDSSVSGQIFTEAGVPLGSRFAISSNLSEALRVTETLDGRVLVVFAEDGDVTGQMVNADGTLDGAKFEIADESAAVREFDAATTADGRLIITWTDPDDSKIKGAVYDPRETGVEVFGTSGDDKYIGSAHDDRFFLGDGADWVSAGNGDDLIFGGRGNDNLGGGDGDDELHGGDGGDSLNGGSGDDTYFADAEDTLVEGLNEGTDTVNALITSGTFTLGANFENLTLLGASNVGGTGNELANVLRGNSGLNTLTGGDGDDLYFVGVGDTVVEANANIGTGGDDHVFVDFESANQVYTMTANVERVTLLGISAGAFGNGLDNTMIGNDLGNTLVGGAGNDVLQGGLGNDFYWVDSLLDQLIETVSEADGGGVDTVQFEGAEGETWVLGDFVENLNLAGTSAINGTGNALDNVITGNEADNIFNGGGGTDEFVGHDGDDTYFVDDLNDVVTEGSGVNSGGSDLVHFVGTSGQTYALTDNVENLILDGGADSNGTGNASGNFLTGNDGANVLMGLGGDDTLFGGAGKDVLTGGADNDVFLFTARSDSHKSKKKADWITDFDDFGNDVIDLTALFGGTLKYKGKKAFKKAGEVRINDIRGPDLLIEVNTHGSKKADFTIVMDDTTFKSMSASDFLL